MKKLILLTVVLLSALGHSQSFRFNADGTADYVVFTAKGLKADKIFIKAMDWVALNYKGQKEGVSAKIDNEMIRIDGLKTVAFTRKFPADILGEYDVAYTLEIEIHDGKYRMKWTHKGITVDGVNVLFDLKDVVGNVTDANGVGYAGAKEQYEAEVGKVMASFHDYLVKAGGKW